MACWYGSRVIWINGLQGGNPRRVNWNGGRPSTPGFPPRTSPVNARSRNSRPVPGDAAMTGQDFQGKPRKGHPPIVPKKNPVGDGIGIRADTADRCHRCLRAFPMGRSTQDLLATLQWLAEWKVSVVAMNGTPFEIDTPRGRMVATIRAGIAQYERDLTSGRMKSGPATG